MRRSVIRRSVLAAACAVALVGCSTVGNDAVVATVDGSEIDQSAFDAVADDYFSRQDLFGTASPTAGRIDGDQSRILLGAIIRQQVLRDLLDEAGVDAADRRQEFLDTTFGSGGFETLGDPILELIADTDGTFVGGLLAEVPAATPAELEAMYRDNPLSTGMVCLRHILVETEAEADEIVGLLADGADFAELADERSTDPSNAGNGGALATAGGQCIPLRTVAQGFDPAFAGAVLHSTSTGLIGTVESSFGWHVVTHRPWDEIADSVLALHTETDSGGYQYDGRIATSDIDINPNFGTWDRLGGGVVPLG